jgi:putative restriction endonuclease
VTGTIAITDFGWYEFLSSHPEVTEINFWTPSARRSFKAPEFSPFLFKLRAPHNAICGFAYFAQYTHMPDWLAWDWFGLGNGCTTFEAMRDRIGAIRDRIRYEAAGSTVAEIGCIQLVAPVFFPRHQWIPQPRDWHVRTQRPTRYDLSQGEGLRVWEACLLFSSEQVQTGVPQVLHVAEAPERYGTPYLVKPRLGQATFRVAVLDAYDRACAFTNEHSLPALEAAHIQPYEAEGPHEVANGILLRADLHRLFDKGYITVTPELRLEVSKRLKEEFHNGRTYYPLHGSSLRPPVAAHMTPSAERLRWHNEQRFVG